MRGHVWPVVRVACQRVVRGAGVALRVAALVVVVALTLLAIWISLMHPSGFM